MSIVAVHGPNTFGSKAVIEAGPVQATVNPANGMIWTFKIDGPTTRVAADFDWTYTPAGGAPASPINDTFSPVITFTGAGAKTVTLTVSGAGAGANPYPPAGAYPISVTTVTGAGPPGTSLMGALPGGGEEPPPEGTPPETSPELAVGFDPGADTVSEVEAYADEHPDQAQDLLDAEVAGKNRSTLVAYLEELIPFDPGDYTVDDVVAYAEANPDQLYDIIAAEQAGKNRSTLITRLEALPAP